MEVGGEERGRYGPCYVGLVRDESLTGGLEWRIDRRVNLEAAPTAPR